MLHRHSDNRFLRALILLTFGGLLPFFNCERTEAQDQNAKCSVFQAALAYAEAIHSGDVLVLEREYFDGVKKTKQNDGNELFSGGTLSRVTLSRTVFDQHGDRALVAARLGSEWLELEQIEHPNQGRSVVASEWGFILDKKKRNLSRKSKAGLQEVPWTDEFSLTEDPRVAGLSGIKFGSFDMAKRAFSTMATGDTLIDSRETEKFLELRINWSRLDDSKANYVRHFYFDKVTHLPARCQTYVEFDAGGRTDPENAHFEWKEISNLYVPIRVKSTAYRSFEGPNREQHHGTVTSEFALHWLSVNEPIPEARFEAANLTDNEKFIGLLDPVENKATSIVEVLKKGTPEASPLEKN